jgi:putative ABC transport system substrate-binding protein
LPYEAKTVLQTAAVIGRDSSSCFLEAVWDGRILHGARPRELPIEQRTQFELVINLRTAMILGMKIPPSLRERADRVIE